MNEMQYMPSFLDDDGLTESEKKDIEQILSSDDSIKCFFLDNEKSIAALRQYEKNQGKLQSFDENQAHLFYNAAKQGSDQWAQSMALYLTAQQAPTGNPAFNPTCAAAFCFPTHGFMAQQQPAAPHGAAFIPQPPAAALLSPPTGGAHQWMRFLAQPAGTPHGMPLFYPVVFSAPGSASQSMVPAEFAGSMNTGVISMNETHRAPSQTVSSNSLFNNEMSKNRTESISTPADAPTSRSNAASLNNSTDSIQAVIVNVDQPSHHESSNNNNNNSGGSGNTDVVPIDPEPNEHLNKSGILLTPEISALREDVSPGTIINSMESRTISTPIDGNMHTTINQINDSDDSLITAQNLSAVLPENSSPEKVDENVSEIQPANGDVTASFETTAKHDEVVCVKPEEESKPLTSRVSKPLDSPPQSAPVTTTATAAAAPSAPKTWASLFRNSRTAANAIVINKFVEDDQQQLTAAIAASQNTQNDESSTQQQTSVGSSIAPRQICGSDKSQFTVTVTSVDRDPPVQKLIHALKNCKLEHKGPGFHARGLKNFSNWCYVNAVLQALLACPPFVHLLRGLSFLEMRSPSSTPMLDALVKFVSEFFGEKYTGRKSGDEKPAPFEPTYVYNVLSSLRSDLGYRGRQEDAEEFLSFVLNHLHEEMASCLNSGSPVDQTNLQNQDSRFAPDVSNASNNDSAEWQQVMPGRKLATARMSKLAPTPIAAIFSGVVRNAFSQTAQKDSVNSESFFTLQLSVQSNDNTSSSCPLTLSTALTQMAHEIILRKDPTRKNDIEISRKTTFHELPLVLILHLKYFTFADDSVKKHMKQFIYNMDLQIDKSLMPMLPNQRNARCYKLFAVVFHHGDQAEGGHYTADIFHGGQWLNMDDGKCEVVPESHVLDYMPPRVPYLLFYRRCDVFSDNRGSSMAANSVGQSGGINQSQYNSSTKNRFATATQDNYPIN